MNEFPLQPTGAFVLRSVSMSKIEGWRRDTVNIDERLAVNAAVTTRITNNHGASTNLAQLLFSGSPAQVVNNTRGYIKLYRYS